MKTKWKMLYLVLAIILFLLIAFPIFQNINSMVYFYSAVPKWFSWVYMPILFMAMIDWVFITLYIQSLLSDSRKQDATKFDLSS